MNTVEMAHGSGGQAMQQLINRLFMEAFNNPWLAEQEDQARIDLATLTAQGDRLAFSTDSYVIDRTPDGRPISKTDQVAKCGNSVCPDLARALVKANFAPREIEASTERGSFVLEAAE